MTGLGCRCFHKKFSNAGVDQKCSKYHEDGDKCCRNSQRDGEKSLRTQIRVGNETGNIHTGVGKIRDVDVRTQETIGDKDQCDDRQCPSHYPSRHIQNQDDKHRAEYDVHVARYYIKRGAYLAAVNRGRNVVENYPKTTAVPNALAVMLIGYTLLDMEEMATDTRRVIELNYPDHPVLKGPVTADSSTGKDGGQWFQFWE